MSFNQIFPLDAISEASRETMSQGNSTSIDTDSLSQCSSQNEAPTGGMASLLGPTTFEMSDDDAADSLEFKPVAKPVDDLKDDAVAQEASDVKDATEVTPADVETGAQAEDITVPETQPALFEPESNTVEDCAPEDTDREESFNVDVEAGCVIIPEAEPAPEKAKDDDIKENVLEAPEPSIEEPFVEKLVVSELQAESGTAFPTAQEEDAPQAESDESPVPQEISVESMNLINLEDDIEQPNILTSQTNEVDTEETFDLLNTSTPRATVPVIPPQPVTPAPSSEPITLAKETVPVEDVTSPVAVVSPVKVRNAPNQASKLEIPPATPSPFKANKQSHSPTVTEPLSPDKADNDDEPKFTSTRSSSRTCGFSRTFIIGIVVLVIAALVGIVVMVMGGGESSSNEVTPAENRPGAPSSPNSPPSAYPPPNDTPVRPSTEPGDADPPQQSPNNQDTAPGKNSPTPVPSPSPSMLRLTSDPTEIPSSNPSDSPSISPAPTAAPSPAWLSVLPQLTDLTPREVLTDSTTMQGQALLWLLDSISVNPALADNAEVLRQRYATSVLDRATFGGNPRVTRVDMDECDWEGVACVNGTITSVVWAGLGLTGTLPDEISALTGLTTLDLGENELTGSLPAGLFNCTALEFLYLHQNQFSGNLSEDFSRLYGLERLYLGNNQFTGSLPQGFGSPFPLNGQAIRRMRKCSVLPKALQLAGRRAPHFATLRFQTGYLSVHNNDLTGPIPENWNLRFLYLLDLSYNRLTGSLPLDWGSASLNRMKLLYINNNELSGPVPATFPNGIGNGRLELWHLSDNQFTGVMPGNFGPPMGFISSLEFQNNLFSFMDSDMCQNLVFGTTDGEVTNFHADCDICSCSFFCGPNLCF